MGASLPAFVERKLQDGEEGQPATYEPALLSLIALAGLLINATGLAWTIYRDLQKDADKPSPQVLGRWLRVSIELPERVTVAQRDRMIAVVVEEVVGESGAPS
jgi:hypothetical protein